MEGNNKMGMKVVGMESANCIELAQDREKCKDMVNNITKLQASPTAENYLTR
jgi:hypothetical protein